MEEIQIQLKKAIEELIEVSKIKKGQIFLIGCSTSEVCGYKIGSHSAEDVGKLLSEVARDTLDEKGIYLAVQCCEHLNRAVVVSNECAEKYGAALTAVKITDTVKLVENGIVKSTCDRNRLFAAQTPQTFDIDIIKNADEKAFADGMEFTDDCAVAEYCGVEIHINEGSIKNRKLTVREDFEWL